MSDIHVSANTEQGQRFVDGLKESMAQDKVKKDVWCEWLRTGGIKAAHPDDGWHHRDADYFYLVYPYFDLDVQAGDRVALGDQDHFLVVTVKQVTKSFYGFGPTKYHY